MNFTAAPPAGLPGSSPASPASADHGSPSSALPFWAALAERINAALPQTQCTRCGYPDCRAYANAMAGAGAAINRCPPGGAEGVARLAALTGQAGLALDPACGPEAPRQLAVIVEADCIGCTLCIKACPVDCILGAPKRMHTVIAAQCTGCELCLPVCPVDCIQLVPVTGALTGWQAWSPALASDARQRYEARTLRAERLQQDTDQRLAQQAAAKLADLPSHSLITDPAALERKRAVVEAALARARARQAGKAGPA